MSTTLPKTLSASGAMWLQGEIPSKRPVAGSGGQRRPVAVFVGFCLTEPPVLGTMGMVPISGPGAARRIGGYAPVTGGDLLCPLPYGRG